jgi:large subunit ribosomal protein L34e
VFTRVTGVALETTSVSTKMSQRVTFRRRLSYNTTSNKKRIVKTPGARLVVQYLKKRASAPKCGDCGIPLPGVCLYY